MKRLVKQFLGLFVVFCLPLLLWFRRRQILILSYHRIIPKSHAEYSMMQEGMLVTDETFRKHVLWVKQYLKIIRLLDLRNHFRNESKPACIITLDDGWLDNYVYAFPILKELNAVATIFLVSNKIGTNECFWPEKLYLLLQNRVSRELLLQHITFIIENENLTAEEHEAIVIMLMSRSDEDVVSLLKEVEDEAIKLGQRFEMNRQVLNKSEIMEMKASGMIDFGSHTVKHTRLNKVSPKQVKYELVESRHQLEDMLEDSVETFCYPSGYHTNEVLKVVSSVYEIACITEKGWVSSDDNIHKLKRVMLHDDVSNTKGLFWGKVLGFF